MSSSNKELPPIEYFPSLGERSYSMYRIGGQDYKREEQFFADSCRGCKVYRLVNVTSPLIKSDVIVKVNSWDELAMENYNIPFHLKNQYHFVKVNLRMARLLQKYCGEPIKKFLNKKMTNDNNGILLALNIIRGCYQSLYDRFHKHTYAHKDVHTDQFVCDEKGEVTLIDPGLASKSQFSDKCKQADLMTMIFVINDIKVVVSRKCCSHIEILCAILLQDSLLKDSTCLSALKIIDDTIERFKQSFEIQPEVKQVKPLEKTPEKSQALTGSDTKKMNSLLKKILLDQGYWKTKHTNGLQLPKGIKKIQDDLEKNNEQNIGQIASDQLTPPHSPTFFKRDSITEKMYQYLSGHITGQGSQKLFDIIKADYKAFLQKKVMQRSCAGWRK